jgi:hypothetical protein
MGMKPLLLIPVLLLLSSLDGACLPTCRGNGISGIASDPLAGIPGRDGFDIVPFNITKGMTKKQVLAAVKQANVLGLWQWDLAESDLYEKDLWVVSKPCFAFSGRHWISVLFKEGVVVGVLEGWRS